MLPVLTTEPKPDRVPAPSLDSVEVGTPASPFGRVAQTPGRANVFPALCLTLRSRNLCLPRRTLLSETTILVSRCLCPQIPSLLLLREKK